MLALQSPQSWHTGRIGTRVCEVLRLLRCLMGCDQQMDLILCLGLLVVLLSMLVHVLGNLNAIA